MALSRTEIQKRSDEKRGVTQKKFKFDAPTIALLEQLAESTSDSQTQVVVKALQLYAKSLEP